MVDGPSTIHEWFPDFIRRHAERCPSQGWPDLPVLGVTPSEATSAFFNPWITRFTREGVSKAAAETASESLASVEVPWPGPKHLDMLMKHVHSAWDVLRARGAGGPELSSREECQARSRGCPECSGQGFTSRMKTIEDYPIPVSMAFFCMCPSGEWMANLYFTKYKDLFDRYRRLAQHPELWDSSLSHHSWPSAPALRDFAIEPGWIPQGPAVIAGEKVFNLGSMKNIGRMPA
jgi:hypothetical protein